MQNFKLTTLMEDFQKIGLIPKQEATSEAEDTTEVEASSLEEKQRRQKKRYAPGSRKIIKTVKQDSAKKQYNKAYYRQNKNEIKKQKKIRARTAVGNKRLTYLDAQAAKKNKKKPMHREDFDALETLKAFANAAIVAEQLQTVFDLWVEDDLCESTDTDWFKAQVERLGEIAEQFAEVATLISEGEELDDEDIETLESAFNEGLETITEAAEVYEANKSEDDEESEEEDEEDEESDD